MSQLKTALVIGVAVLAASVGSAQAKTHTPHSLFDLINGLGNPHLQIQESGVRIPAVDLNDPNNPPKKPDGSDKFEWVFVQADGSWHLVGEQDNLDKFSSTPAVQPQTQWTMQTVQQPQQQWTPHPASP